jgi:hypothetical protein
MGVMAHVRGHVPGNLGAIGDPFDETLHRAHAHAKRFIQPEMHLNQRSNPIGHRHDPPLRFEPEWLTFAVDDQASTLPVDVARL